ncbi:tetratricopeptide repeat protein [Lacimicrobium alkaliphilum]|uniref:Sulfotransferase domain-containing protein n=1 Tax=Lacimicrobium alkaliphilum TaxID=1526571 RepID=A0ABQ1R691_9ALTE|nr:tetratricopeptide repeat protein [Lacimicrobium alkaliphilum]GGD57518.1 hypothetical protein GCM10011357_11160 [Lacimicrobium alkaliphilum]
MSESEQLSQSNTPFYLCTGFHRSGTSLVAQSLARGGVNMGGELMGASFSNPLGHVEDMPAVRMHDQLLALNNSDWRFYDQRPLIKPVWAVNYIRRYLSDKHPGGALAGVKDPRALFYLNDWLEAGQGSLRFILLYRHWATAAQSLLNRASRHLVNGRADVATNKVNFSFWQQPQLAFAMWQASNQRLLNFYQRYPQHCLLIAQEGFVANNHQATQVAGKIGLPHICLKADTFKPGLMTDSVSPSVLAILAQGQQQSLDSLWQALQQQADVPAPQAPDIAPPKVFAGAQMLGIECKGGPGQPEADKSPAPQYNLAGLSWHEALGVIAGVPEGLVSEVPFLQIFRRPYDQSTEDYFQSLAKLAHGAGYLHLTRLSKFRAMYASAGHWQTERWQLFTEDDCGWHNKPDHNLQKANPFSLHPRTEFTRQLQFEHLLQTEWSLLSQGLKRLKRPALHQALTELLLFRSVDAASGLTALAQLAGQQDENELAECFRIKALRREYSVDTLVGLGDFYLGIGQHQAAHQALTEALALAPDMPVIKARMAASYLQLSQPDKAESLLLEAEKLTPNQPVVKRSRARFNQFMAQQNAADQPSEQAGQSEYQPPLQPYEEILALSRDNPALGQALDLHNRRIAFVLRNNRQWLRKAMVSLTPTAAESLAEKIDQQWCRIWPAEVVDFVLGQPVGWRGKKNVSSGDSCVGAGLALMVMITEAEAGKALLGLISHLVPAARLVVFVSEQCQQPVRDYCEAAQLKPAEIKVTDAGAPEQAEIEVPQDSLLAEAHWLGLLNTGWWHKQTDKRAQEASAEPEWLLQQWYNLLCPQLTGYLDNNHSAAKQLIVPPLYPLHQAEDAAVSAQLPAEQLPTSMCWVNNPEAGASLSPDKLMAHGYQLAFSHQLLSEPAADSAE